jgi:hypothetical protein
VSDKVPEDPPAVQDDSAEVSALELEENLIQVLGFFVADHVAHENGKLYVNGGCFSTIFAASFPTNHPSIGIAAILHIPWREYQRDHTFRITLTSPENQELDFKVEGQFRVGASPDMRLGDPTIMPIAVNANAVRLETPGHYKFVFAVDDKPLAFWRLRALQTFLVPGMPAPPGMIPPPAGS